MITDILELIYGKMQGTPREFDLIIPVALYALPEKWEIRGNSLVGDMKLTSLARDGEFSTPLLSRVSVSGPLRTRPTHELLARLLKGHAVQMSVARPRLYSYDKVMIEVLSQDGWKMLTSHGLRWNDDYRRAVVATVMHDNRKYVYGVRTQVYDQKAAEARTFRSWNGNGSRYIHSWSSLPSDIDLADYALQLGVEHDDLPVVLSFNRATYPLSLMTLRMRALRPCRLADDMQLDADLLEAEPGLTAAALIERAGTGGPALLYRLSAKPHAVEMLARLSANWSVEDVTYPVPELKLQGSDCAIPTWAETICEDIANMARRGVSSDEIAAYVEQHTGDMPAPTVTVAQSSDGRLEVTLGDGAGNLRYTIMPTDIYGASPAALWSGTSVNLTMDDARTLPDGPPVQATDGGRPVDVQEQLDTPLATEIRAVRPTTGVEVPFVQL